MDDTQSPDNAAQVELLPCPFCGSDDIKISNEVTPFLNKYDLVRCLDCNANIDGALGGGAKEWNTRTLAPDQTTLIAKLREALLTAKERFSLLYASGVIEQNGISTAVGTQECKQAIALIDSQAKTNGGV